jgi:hypothetical protein
MCRHRMLGFVAQGLAGFVRRAELRLRRVIPVPVLITVVTFAGQAGSPEQCCGRATRACGIV